MLKFAFLDVMLAIANFSWLLGQQPGHQLKATSKAHL